MRCLLIACLALLCIPSSASAQLCAEEKKITVDDRERSFFVFAPRSARSSDKAPLVLVLHGGGGSGRQMERHTRFNAIARREGLIICYPEGHDKNWNDGRDVDFIETQSENIDDVKFLRAAVETISKEHPVDRSRVFSTGISNGAFMSHRLANDASDMVCAIAPVVGGIAEPIAKTFAPKHPVSLFVIQGDADPLVPLDGGEVGIGRKRRGKLIPTEETIAKYVKLNKIQGEPATDALPDKDPGDETTTDTMVYPDGKGGFKVQYYLVNNGGHTWPGTVQYAPELLIGKVCRDFDATTEIWQFFKSCPPRK